LKEIQEWLGHSYISTTSNIYTHLDFTSKVASANAIIGIYPTAIQEVNAQIQEVNDDFNVQNSGFQAIILENKKPANP
jgi:hypothetical protein